MNRQALADAQLIDFIIEVGSPCSVEEMRAALERLDGEQGSTIVTVEQGRDGNISLAGRDQVGTRLSNVTHVVTLLEMCGMYKDALTAGVVLDVCARIVPALPFGGYIV